MVDLRRVDRPGTFPVWTEVHPTHCPGCHQPYRGNHVAVGWLACWCDNTGPAVGHGHRTLFCRDCEVEVFIPPHLGEHGPRAG